MVGTTRELADYLVRSNRRSIPAQARHVIKRAYLNWLGCALAGSRHEAVTIAMSAVETFCGPEQATVLGRQKRVDVVNAGFLNCMSSSVDAFDDTDSTMMLHPTSPVAAAVFAAAEQRGVCGADFLDALILGVEVEYRLCKALSAPPARRRLGFYLSGLTGAVGAAAGVGKLMGFDEQKIVNAIAIAATGAAGFQEALSSMCCPFVPSNAARGGTMAALLAAKGFAGSERTIEGARGFAAVFSDAAHLAAIGDELGERYELMSLTFKPYPCGIVIHPSIDGCLALLQDHGFGARDVARVELTVDPLTLELTGNQPAPSNSMEAQVSIQHWTAATIARGRAGIEESEVECIRDPIVCSLRDRVVAKPDPRIRRDEAIVRIILNDERAIEVHVDHCRGSADRPMTDRELDEKFRDCARRVVPVERIEQLIKFCWNIDDVSDMRVFVD